MKKIIVVLLLICSLFSFTGCAQEPEIQIQYVDRYIEIPTAHGTHEGFIWDPYTKEDKIIIICDDCGKQLGEINKITKTVTIEKEVEKIVYQEVPIEVEKIIEKEIIKEIPIEVEKIIEKEVIKEVLISPADLTYLTWQDIQKIQIGDTLNNVVMVDGYFVSGYELIEEYYDSSDKTQWNYFTFNYITPCSLFYGGQLSFSRYFNYSICCFSGTVSNIKWFEDEFGNKKCEIYFNWGFKITRLCATKW